MISFEEFIKYESECFSFHLIAYLLFFSYEKGIDCFAI